MLKLKAKAWRRSGLERNLARLDWSTMINLHLVAFSFSLEIPQNTSSHCCLEGLEMSDLNPHPTSSQV